MEENIRRILHSHWRYHPNTPTWKIYLPNGEIQETDSNFVKETLINKFKELKKKYDKIYEHEKRHMLLSNETEVEKTREIRRMMDIIAKEWYRKWQRLTEKTLQIDVRDAKAGLTAKKVLELYGRNIKMNKTHCIAHKDEHPSMHVYEKNVYCFSCGYHGDVVDMVMRLENTDFKSALKRLAELK
jgi:hypothetical protein